MQPISLLELNMLIKQTLNAKLAPSYWVIAEIGELRMAQKGHCYLELVEKEGNFMQAKLRATIWATTFRNISGWFETITGQPLKAGMKVLANISIEFHEMYGLSANIKDIDPNFTLGERARKRQEIIDRLLSEGVFDMNKLLQMPVVPQKIALISSSTAAGYGDFMDHLQKNDYHYHFDVDLYNSVMQGCDAPKSIIHALHKIHKKIEAYDLVVLVRGGGAQVDMDCFDDYDLACHLAQFPIPVVTGIGHERDESVTDLVAHTKFKTPTAVSAYLVTAIANFEGRLYSLIQKMDSLSRSYCHEQTHVINAYAKFFSYQKTSNFERQASQLSQFKQRIAFLSKQHLKHSHEKLDSLKYYLKPLAKKAFEKQQQKIDYLHKTLTLSDPEIILKKGYTISYIDNKHIDSGKPKKGLKLITRSEKFKIESIINSVSPIENGEKEL